MDHLVKNNYALYRDKHTESTMVCEDNATVDDALS